MTVKRPEVIYHTETETIDIIGVIATSNTPTIEKMDSTETQVNYYQIYDSFNAPTGLSGNMTWKGDSWEAKNVDVSSLSLGEYYVRCFFADHKAIGVSRPSKLFNISPALPSTTSMIPPFVEEFPMIFLLTTIIATLLICDIKILRKLRP